VEETIIELEPNNAGRLICSVPLLRVVWIFIVMSHNIIRDRNVMTQGNNRLPAEQDKRSVTTAVYYRGDCHAIIFSRVMVTRD
jgi:hypothetical protein